MDAFEAIAALLHELGVPTQALSLLVAHARAVERDADRLGLTSDRGLEAILLRHTADSLLVALARRPGSGEVWLDAGSGAGFPGLVLACAFPETTWTLLEPQARRAGFLELQVMNLGLAGVSVRRERIEQVAEASVDVVVARALVEPARWAPELRRCARTAVLVATSAAGAAAIGEGEIRDVARPHVDSPGQVLIMRASR